MVWLQEKRVDGVLIVKKVKYLKGLFFVARNSIVIDRQDFDRNFLNIYEGTQVEEVRIWIRIRAEPGWKKVNLVQAPS